MDYLYVSTSAIIKSVQVGILKHHFCKGERNESFTQFQIYTLFNMNVRPDHHHRRTDRWVLPKDKGQ